MANQDPKPSYPNINQRTPCVLVLDASGSMASQPIDQLNRGLKTLESELKNDPTARTHVQVAIVVVGGPGNQAGVMMDWTDASAYDAPELTAGGETPLGAGLLEALKIVEEQKQVYKADGLSYTRPWMMVITDGAPTDEATVWQEAVKACKDAESRRKCIVYPIAVQGANVQKLQEISSTRALMLDELKFVELFQWLSASMTAMSQSTPGDNVQLPSTDAWAAVKI